MGVGSAVGVGDGVGVFVSSGVGEDEGDASDVEVCSADVVSSVVIGSGSSLSSADTAKTAAMTIITANAAAVQVMIFVRLCRLLPLLLCFI